MPVGNRYRIETVFQAFQVLKVIADSKEPIGPAEIIKRLDMTMNTAFRMCETLDEVGALRKIGDKYELGMALALFWARVKAKREETERQARNDINLLNGGE